jgi:hypothetical protein
MNNVCESIRAADTSATALDDAVVAQLRAAVLQATAIKQAHARSVREAAETELNEDLAKFAAAAPARAAEIIANIPSLIMATRGDIVERDHVEVMVLDRRESVRPSSNPEHLRYAARTVFDYCDRAGLHPRLAGRTIGDKCECDYFVMQIRLDQTT